MKRDQMNERDSFSRGPNNRFSSTYLEVKKLIEFDSYGNVAIA